MKHVFFKRALRMKIMRGSLNEMKTKNGRTATPWNGHRFGGYLHCPTGQGKMVFLK
jgi:hypothetical protein